MIKSILHNVLSCLFNSMQIINIYNGSALDVKVQGKSLINPFFFIYLFVSLYAHASVRAYRVHVFKKQKKKKKKKKKKKIQRNKRHMQVWWKNEECQTKWPYVIFLLQRSCSNCADTHAHAGLKLCWSYVFLDVVSYFMLVFFTVKTQRP